MNNDPDHDHLKGLMRVLELAADTARDVLDEEYSHTSPPKKRDARAEKELLKFDRLISDCYLRYLEDYKKAPSKDTMNKLLFAYLLMRKW